MQLLQHHNQRFINQRGNHRLPLLFKTIIIALLYVITVSTTAFAEEVPGNEDFPFSVMLEFPSNQKVNTRSYFDLDVKAGHEQEIFVVLSNKSDKDIVIAAKGTNALSSDTGIVYVEERNLSYSTLLEENFYLDNYTQMEKEISLSAHETRRVPVSIALSDKISEGTILGGITFGYSYTDNEKTDTESDVSFSVKNTLNYNIGLQLNISELTDVTPIVFKNVYTEINSKGISLFTEVTNSNSQIENNFSLNYKIENEKQEVIFEGDTTEINLSPQSTYKHPIKWGAETFTPGNYTLITSSNNSGDKTETRQEFSIKRNDVKEFAIQTGKKLPNPLLNASPLIWVIVGVLLASCIFLFLWFWKRRKKDEEDNDVAPLEEVT